MANERLKTCLADAGMLVQRALVEIMESGTRTVRGVIDRETVTRSCNYALEYLASARERIISARKEVE